MHNIITMTQSFDFDNIGKRLPYTMPSETFSNVEANVFAVLERDMRTKKTRLLIRWCSFIGIAAACAAFILIVKPTASVQDNKLKQIDIAYANLSESDKDFLIEIYNEDLFMNQEQ